MKILYITDPATLGGATMSLMDLLINMKDKGIESFVITSGFNNLNQRLNELQIPNFACDHITAMETKSHSLKYRIIRNLQFYKHNFDSIRRIYKNIDISSFDIIHTNSSRSDIGVCLAKKHGIPHIMHIREFGYEDYDCVCYRPFYSKYLNSGVNHFICVSNAVREAWGKRGIDLSKSTIIYNGINPQRFGVLYHRDKVNNELKLVFVGTIQKNKGQLEILKALRIIPNEIRKYIYLDIIGTGDYNYILEMRNFLKQHDIQNVNIIEEWLDIPPLLNHYDVGLTCSKNEGFGRVTAEYMHAGLGVIASNRGANPELITHLDSGLLYKYNDSQSLADCILRFYNDRKLLAQCGNNAKLKANNMFTDSINAESIYQLYLSVLNK